MRLIPPEAAVALVIPSLKSCSDEFTQCLEGMERAQFLLGSRPLDQLKSWSGLNVGVDDLGGFALVMVERGQTLSPLVLVPVSDAKAFLAGNFATHNGDRYTRPDGLSVTARDLGSHVLLSTDETAAREYASQSGLASAIREELAAADRIISRGEAFVFARRVALTMLSERMRASAMAMGAKDIPQPTLARSALMVIDVDPLAVIVLGLARFDEGVLGTVIDKSESEAGMNMGALPDKPFYAALAADMGSVSAIRSLLGNASTPAWPEWLLESKTIQFAAYPSPAGLAGGLLNDSALVFKTNEPGAARDAIKTALLALAQDADGLKREVKWEDSRPVKDIGNASAFEIRTPNAPPAMAQQQMVEQLLFGRSAIRGFVSTADRSVVVTFSQRPAVLASALAAITDPATSLESSPMLTTMRQWMPAQRDAEAYVGVAQLVEMSRQVMQSFGLADGPIPAVDANAPPVGFAMDVEAVNIEASLVLPSPIVAMMFDEVMRQFSVTARTPGQTPADDVPVPKDQQ